MPGSYAHITMGSQAGAFKLFNKTMSLNGSSPSPITEEEKQDGDSGCGFNSLICRETHTGAGKALSM